MQRFCCCPCCFCLCRQMPESVFCQQPGLCLGGSYVDKLAALFAYGEYHNAVGQSVECVVLADTDVFTRMVNGSTLTLDDITRLAVLTTENLHAESFAF